jgi:LCP family protein required for cell wall assembly
VPADAAIEATPAETDAVDGGLDGQAQTTSDIQPVESARVTDQTAPNGAADDRAEGIDGAVAPDDDALDDGTRDAQSRGEYPVVASSRASGNGSRPSPEQTETDDGDFADYARSVEAAAARSRAALRGSTDSPALETVAVAALPASIPAERPAPVRPLPQRGGPRGPRGRGRPGRRQRQPDPRPLHKRPLTWVVILAMIPVIAGIVGLLYFGNLLKTTIQAYNEAHVEPQQRDHYTVNAQGTPELVPTEQVQAQLPNWDENDTVNILLLGIDERPGDEEPARTDTMIVVHVNPATKYVTMMSIPRDLLVTIPGFGDDKINAAFTLGEANTDTIKGGGPTLVQQTIEANFGITIHYFATVDFDGFRAIIDEIGGIVLDVPASVKDDLYPTENFGVTRIYFPTGLQAMDGEAALRYARTRHGDNDIARGMRQQQVLQAIRAQAITLGLISQANDLIREAGDAVRTDLNFNQMLALANLGRGIDANHIIQLNLWEAGVLSEHLPEYEGDAFYMVGDWSSIYNLMDEYFHSEVPPLATPTPQTQAGADLPGATVDGEIKLDLPVVVRNSAGVDLLAAGAVQLLADAGFDEVYPDQGDVVEATTVIYDNVGSPATCAYIARVLGIPESAIVSTPDSGATAIEVVLGADAPIDVILGE